MELIRGKRTGKVLLIVEGGRHEFNLIKKIYVNILGFTQIEKKRTDAQYYVRNADCHSLVAVINTKTSNISSITEIEYLDTIYTELIEKFDFDVNNAAIYYLFDRDPESNTDRKLIIDLIHLLKNSRENDSSMRGGMLILSYPSIEAFEISNFTDESYEMYAKLGSEIKEYININAKKISMNKISEESIIHATEELVNFLHKNKIEMNLDDFSEMNLNIFHREEECLNRGLRFRVLSMLSCVFLDLGILRD